MVEIAARHRYSRDMSHEYKSDKRGNVRNPNARMEKLVFSITVPDDGLTGYVGASQLDLSRMPVWIEELRDAEARIRRLRLALQARLDGVERVCIVCGTPIIGRAGKMLCGARCRKRFNRGAPTPYAGHAREMPTKRDS